MKAASGLNTTTGQRTLLITSVFGMPLICLGCNKDQWSWGPKYISYVALRVVIREQGNGLLM